jgi:hypothetical protein
MKRILLLSLCMAFFAPFSIVLADGFPTAPTNMKEAESLGLHRLNIDELKAFFPGVVKTMGTTGKHKLTFNPDGSVERKGFHDTTGNWRFDEKNNTYCLAFTESAHKLGKSPVSQENCFAVFGASDGVFHFDYDIERGFYTKTWRRVSGE